MEQRRLGASGLAVSIAGLGCNNFRGAPRQARTPEVVNAALDVGVTFFDTARSYGEGRSRSTSGCV